MAVSNPETLETNLKGVYVIGDANRGPATIVEAIADATKAVNNICTERKLQYEADNINADATSVRAKRGILYATDSECPAGRCLECSTVCESCMDVCPNRANVVVMVQGRPQIVHVDRMCNECGNCEIFCPYDSAPYKDKFTLFNLPADFEDSTNNGFCVVDGSRKECLVRIGTAVQTVTLSDVEAVKEAESMGVTSDLVALMETMIENYNYMMEE